jgi:hypothetical protein
MLYKKNVPEHALANIFKKRRTEIRARILKIINKQLKNEIIALSNKC